ncbi:MAG: tRNA preQ1(34) S-adenosylmethionine ribosyltransferase-isomerase QueA [Chloroflexi bacterium]|nr:tRNA preQ1(34) S-adenosylmethionine ribosyltransferase-isomerase QueA [Chloroflexota bacterium]
MATDLFDYALPPELIAQQPAEPRDASRLLVVDRATGELRHTRFSELGCWLRAGDLLVVNRSRVVPARLHARRRPGAGSAEILLLQRCEPGLWEGLVRPGGKLPPGAVMDLDEGVTAEVVERTASGGRLLRFATSNGTSGDDVDAAILALGSLPLPPYIHDYHGDPERYQTVYSDILGSAAAPTAGLHFTRALLDRLTGQGVKLATVTLHVGLDTFRPVREDDLTRHAIHSEVCSVPRETVCAIREARAGGGRVVAVGTTTVRSLETAARATDEGGPDQAMAGEIMVPWAGPTSLYILPGFRFRAVDALVTNFHLPRSTLLALVSALAGRDLILRAYREAVEQRYRFFSFGDAMLIL